MDKFGRKSAKNPAQEKLRQEKEAWNEKVKAFMSNFIQFKKTMNGSPSKFHNDKSKITEPIPSNPGAILSNLADNFATLVDQANEIIEHQNGYNSERVKDLTNKKQELVVKNKDSEQELIDKLNRIASLESSDLDTYQLYVDASNPFSRFFTRLFNPTIGVGDKANIRRLRVNSLNGLARSFKLLEKFQVEIVKSGDDSITSAELLFRKAFNEFVLVYRNIIMYRNSVSPDAVKDPYENSLTDYDQRKDDSLDESEEAEIDTIKPPKNVKKTEVVENKPAVDAEAFNKTINHAVQIINDYRYFLNNNKNKAIYKQYAKSFNFINQLIDSFITTKGFVNVEKRNKRMIDICNSIMIISKSLIEDIDPNAKSFKDLLKNEVSEETATPAVVNKTAQDLLKKWFGKSRHLMSVFDNTSNARLTVYESAEVARDKLDLAMNSLEKGINTDELYSLLVDVNKKMLEIRGQLRPLKMLNPKSK